MTTFQAHEFKQELTNSTENEGIYVNQNESCTFSMGQV